MRFRIAVALLIGTAIAFTSGATFAHHSFAAEFDNRLSVTLHGVIASVEVVNPHSFIYIDVESDGEVSDGRWRVPVRIRFGEENGISISSSRAPSSDPAGLWQAAMRRPPGGSRSPAELRGGCMRQS